jgi:hypothetical protein
MAKTTRVVLTCDLHAMTPTPSPPLLSRMATPGTSSTYGGQTIGQNHVSSLTRTATGTRNVVTPGALTTSTAS